MGEMARILKEAGASRLERLQIYGIIGATMIEYAPGLSHEAFWNSSAYEALRQQEEATKRARLHKYFEKHGLLAKPPGAQE